METEVEQTVKNCACGVAAFTASKELWISGHGVFLHFGTIKNL